MSIIAGERKFFPPADLEIEVFKLIALFSGVGLLVSLVFMSYGLDLGAF